MKSIKTLCVWVVLVVLLVGCAAPQAEVKPTEKAGLANPASVNCTDKGGKLQIVDTPDGQIGICTFEDSSVCEEWAFFKQECKPGELLPRNAGPAGNKSFSKCLDQNGKIFSLEQDKKETVLCVLPSAKICELSTLAAGTCK
jgi:putative hemolysin